jgi:glucokinase
MLLAGDIGGTKTDLAVFSPECFSAESGPRAPLVEAMFLSGDYASLEAVVGEFLSQNDLAISRASFGVAGPVVDGRAKITNLPWEMAEDHLEEVFGFPVRLLNDLEAIAYVVPFLQADDLETLNEGEPAPGGAIAVIAPGTGLGEAYLTWDGAHYRAHASEGGHASFAPHNALETELLRYLQERFGHVSCERVCSGQGIVNIYAFFKDSGYEEPDWLAVKLAAADDLAPIVTGVALDRDRACEICTAVLDTFVSILGAESGNMALKVLATGGVYLGGGIPPHILPALKQECFLEAFRYKGRFADLLARVPVHVILNPKAALLGAACHGLNL